MYQSHEFSLKLKQEGDINLFQPPLTYLDQLHQISFLNSSSQLVTCQQFKTEEVHTPTTHRITAICPITLKSLPLIALGTEDLNQQAHILIYDQLKKTLINSIDIPNQVSKISFVSDSLILVACDDYLYAYQLSTSKTTGGFQELFWSVSAKILQIYPLASRQNPTRISYCLLGGDLNLRLFENEVLISEYKTFSKTQLVSCKYFASYFGVLSKTMKFKLIYIEGDKFKLLMNQDVKDVLDLEFVFKPFAKNLNNQGDFIEKQIEVNSPTPFVLLQYKERQELMFLQLESGKLLFKRLLNQPIKGSSIQRVISEKDEFEVFIRQYIEGIQLGAEELPFTADQVRQDCRQLLAIKNENNVQVLEFPFIFNFQFLLEALNEMEGSCLEQLGIHIPKKNKGAKGGAAGDALDVDEADEAQNAQGAAQGKKKVRKTKKRKTQHIEENMDYLELCQIQSDLFADKMAQIQSQQNIEGLFNSDLQLQFSDKGDLVSEVGKVQAYCINFDGKPYLYNKQPVENLSIASNFDFNSDILNNAVTLPNQMSIRDFTTLSTIQKQKFVQMPQQYELPVNISSSVQQATVLIEKGGQMMCQIVDVKTCVLPAYKIVRFESHTSQQTESCCSFVDVTDSQFKLLFQLQNVVCQLEADFFHPVVKTSLSPTLHAQKFENISDELYISYDQASKVLSITAQNLRALFSYAYVAMKAAKLSEPQILISEQQQQFLKSLLLSRLELSKKSVTTHQNIQDLIQAQMFAVNEITNSLAQKQFENVFGQYDGVMTKGFNDASILAKQQQLFKEARENLDEIVQLYTGFSKERGQKVAVGVREAGAEGADEWVRLWQ